MDTLRRIARPFSFPIVFALLLFGIYAPAVQASMVGTEAVIDATQVQQNRVRLHEILSRDDVKALLVARGVDPSQAQARVDSLTDQEVQTLSARMDQLPAGGDFFGDALGLAVFVFLVLLITDILGFTDVFPFVKHPKR